MKQILVLWLLTNATTVMAQDHLEWFCTASGLDASNRTRSISGEYKPRREDAEQSALTNCRGIGLAACQVDSCFQLPK